MNLRDYLLILRRRKWIGILVLAAALATSAILTTLAVPVYQARATLFVGFQAAPVGSDPNSAFAVSNTLSVAERLTKTYAAMIQSRAVAERAVADFDLGLDPGFVQASASAAPIEGTQLISLVVSDTDPARASNVANATASAFVDIATAITEVPGTDSAPVVPVTVFEEAAIPGGPVSPNASRNLALATVLGIMAAVGMMFAAEYLDVAIRGPEDVDRAVGIPVLALIPRIVRADLRLTEPPGRPLQVAR